MIEEIEDVVVKLYNSNETEKLVNALMQVGEVPFSKEELEEVISLDPVHENEMPIYAFYDKDEEKWVVDVECPEGLVDVMDNDDALDLLEDLAASGKYKPLQEQLKEEDKDEVKSQTNININLSGADAATLFIAGVLGDLILNRK